MPLDQPNNPLHGVTLKAIVEDLHARHGWPSLAEQIPVRCFEFDPSVRSSLKFLRRTPWAREKVERLYVADQKRIGRERKREARRAARQALHPAAETTAAEE